MNKASWHVLQYDISDPARLRKVHRLLKTCTYALQYSVFAWCGTQHELASLKKKLHQLSNQQQDDIRSYRLKYPLMLFGRTPFLANCYLSKLPMHQHYPIEWLARHPSGLFEPAGNLPLHWMLCYDISDSKRRSRASRLLRKHSLGYQKSGFELSIINNSDLYELNRQLAPLINEEEDSLIMFRAQHSGPDWRLGTAPAAGSGLLLFA